MRQRRVLVLLLDFGSDLPRQKVSDLALKTLIAVPTVEALAYNLYDTKGLICPIMDARRNQVYTGIYRYKDHKLVTVKAQTAMSDG